MKIYTRLPFVKRSQRGRFDEYEDKIRKLSALGELSNDKSCWSVSWGMKNYFTSAP